MQRTGEWGDHFPSRFSPFGYNETVAQEYFPLSEEEATKQGYQWRRGQDDVSAVSRVVAASALPDSISGVPNNATDWAIQCEVTGRPFRIIKQELDFYRQLGLPLPHLHPDERYRHRMALRNPRKLWSRPCTRCSKEMMTTYQPSRPEIIYCEQCYLDTVS
jgi:hypothetical protein